MWCMRLKGSSFPLFFKPVGIPTASACGCLLFADTFHYGRQVYKFYRFFSVKLYTLTIYK